MKQKKLEQVIAITNQKGGVGKTTATIHLGVGLVKKGYKVLLIDLDPQGSLTYYLGFNLDSLSYSMSDLFEDLIGENKWESQTGILHHEEQIDLFPACPKDIDVEDVLCHMDQPEHYLRKYTDLLKPFYDFILIDCGPFRGKLMLNALTAADQVIIPSESQTGAMVGMTQLLETIFSVREKSNFSLRIAGILITKTRQYTKYEKNVAQNLRNTYGNELTVFSSMVPLSVRAGEVVDHGCSVFKYDPKGSVATAYEKVVEEILYEYRQYH